MRYNIYVFEQLNKQFIYSVVANCMKHDCDITALAECMFVDSMRVLQNSGYKRPRFSNSSFRI